MQVKNCCNILFRLTHLEGRDGVHTEMYTYTCFKHYRKIKSTAVEAQYK